MVAYKQLALGFTAFVACLAGVANAQNNVSAPAELERWRGWVEQSNPHRNCVSGSVESCLWTGQLEVEESGNNWRISFKAQNDAAVPIAMPIPGGVGQWPKGFSFSGKPMPIGESSQLGAVAYLPAKAVGSVSYELPKSPAGQAWGKLARYPLISLKLAGKPASMHDSSDFSADAEMSKSSQKEKAVSEPRGDIQKTDAGMPKAFVSRHISDATTPILTMRVKVENGNQKRQVSIASILPKESEPIRISAPGGKFSGNELSWTAPAGSSVVTVVASLPANYHVSWVKPQSQTLSIAEKAFLSISFNEQLRKVAASGDSIDPKTVDGALNFGQLTTFATDSSGAGVSLEPKSREEAASETKGSVRSQYWLSHDGQSVYGRQSYSFLSAQQGWFEPSGSWSLLNATGDAGPQLVVKGDSGGKTLISNNQPRLDVGVGAGGSQFLDFPAVGGSGISASSSDVEINLPIGYRIFGVSGQGSSSDGWIASMSLWDWFLVIIACWMAKSLAGWRYSVVVFSAMALGRFFNMAPFVEFVPLMALVLVHKHLPDGKFRKFALGVAAFFMAVLLAHSLPYTLSRVQKTLHVELDDAYQPGSLYSGRAAMTRRHSEDQARRMEAAEAGGFAGAAPAEAPPMPAAPGPAAIEQAQKMKESVSNVMSDATVGSMALAPRKPFKAEIKKSADAENGWAQAGQSVPEWRGMALNIHFSGPATASDFAKVYLISPWQVKLLSVAALLALWCVLLISAVQLLIASGRAPALPGKLGRFLSGDSNE